MHREAELGIAAHWNYKEGSRTLDRLTRRVRPAAEGDDGGEADDEPLDRIFVLTPRGDVVELPAGATPLDFAFSVHTALGLSYKGSKVNGAIVPMEHPLENGDVVEIIRSAEPHPSVRWMPLLKTAAARARLRKALAERHREAYIDRGRQALNQALKTRRLPALDTDLSVLASLGGEPADMQRRSDFLARLGQGTLKLAAALGTIDAVSSRLAQKSKAAPAAVADGWNVVLEADVHLSHRFARCCKPDTGKREAVVGVVSRQRVVIHRQKCKALKTVAAERRIPAEWVAPIVSVSRGKKR
jgi:GTP pyrophosphokinase